MVLHLPQINNLYSFPVDFQQFIDEIPAGVLILDKKRRIILMNRMMQAITGFSQEEAAGRCKDIDKSQYC